MGNCCGLCAKRKSKDGTEDASPNSQGKKSDKSEDGNATRSSSLPRRGSLNSVLSGNSVYFDAQEDVELSGSDSEDHRGPLNSIREDGSQKGSGLSSIATHPDNPRLYRPQAGSSFRKSDQVGTTDGIECWQVADATTLMVRGKDYMSSKRKVHARGAIYRLIGVDCYSFAQKLFHISEHVQLPEAPKLAPKHAELPAEQQLPPLLVINIQLPMYKAGGLLGGGQTDGKGVSLVYYFALPEGFEPEDMENKAALGLMQRFACNGKEQNGDKTRDRLKLIARVVNVEEWAKEGPLSGYEHSLLSNYNDKPILTRPQQQFFAGEDYLEVDLDVHSYAWLARKAFANFIPRLGPVIFENAFVIQGNRPEELPELVMACARVSRIDLSKAQPFPATLKKTKSHRTTIEMDSKQPLNATTFPDDDLSPSPPNQKEDFLCSGTSDKSSQTSASHKGS